MSGRDLRAGYTRFDAPLAYHLPGDIVTIAGVTEHSATPRDLS